MITSNVIYLKEIYLIISSATDNAANTSTLKIIGLNISSLCVRHKPEPFKYIQTSLSGLSDTILCVHAVNIAFTTLARGTTYDGLSGYFISRIFEIFLFCFVFAICDLVHDVETIFSIPKLLTASGFFLKYE